RSRRSKTSATKHERHPNGVAFSVCTDTMTAARVRAAPLVRRTDGVLVADDTTLDKPDSHHIQLVTRHRSGNHHQVASGINLITLVWTYGDRLYPSDYRIYLKAADGKTRNDHLRDLLACAHARGFNTCPRNYLPAVNWCRSLAVSR